MSMVLHNAGLFTPPVTAGNSLFVVPPLPVDTPRQGTCPRQLRVWQPLGNCVAS
jgi:hypothetical protein